MALSTEYKLKYQIDADAGKAKAELKDVDRLITSVGGGSTVNLQKGFKEAASEASNLVGIFTGNRLTGATSQLTSFAGAIGAIPGPAGLAFGAVSGLTVAAVGLGVALFASVEKASEFGSVLHDAGQKTGLSADAISALKLAADSSGSSLEQVTGGLAKFAKTVGAAADGSQKAKDQLIALGIDPQDAINDLDGALDKVFKQIADAKPGIEQITLAQKAFGKSGADLIPVILQMAGKFNEAVEAAKKLGVTLSQDDLDAADNFGDSLHLIGTQAEITADKFLLRLAPYATSAMQQISLAIEANQDTIARWVETFSQTLSKLATAVNFVNTVLDTLNQKLYSLDGGLKNAGHGIDTTLIVPLDRATDAANRMIKALVQLGLISAASEGHGQRTAAEGGGFSLGGDFEDAVTGAKARRGGGRSAKSTADQEEAKRIARIRKDSADEIALRVATDQATLASIKNRLAEGEIDEKQALEETHQVMLTNASDLDHELLGELDFKRKVYRDTLEMVRGNAVEEERITREQALLEEQIAKTLLEQKTETFEFEKKQNDEILKKAIDNTGKLLDLEQKRLETIKKQDAELIKQGDLIGSMVPPGFDAAGNATAKAPGGRSSTGNPFLDALFGSQGMDIFQTNAQIMTGVITELGQTVGDVFAQMSQALGQGISDWVLYGGSIGEALKKATAAVLAQIAAQAAVKAIYYTAEGIAALFYNPAAAAGFFTAAAIFGSIAVGSALVGRAVAGNSFNGKGAKGSASGSASSSNVNQNPTPYSRSTPEAFVSGRPEDRHIAALASAVDKLQQKISGMNPGDVLTAGAQQRKGFIGRQTVEDIRSNSGIGTNLMRATGNK